MNTEQYEMKEWEGNTQEGSLNYSVLPDVNVGFSTQKLHGLYQTKPKKNLPLTTQSPSHKHIVKILSILPRKKSTINT